MPTLVRENIDNLNARLKLTITRDEINEKLNNELKQFRNKAQIKGFRKGKTPLGFIKKVYGKSLFSDIIQKTIQNELEDFMKAGEVNFLGQPIPVENEVWDFDNGYVSKEDLHFNFDLGLIPEIELKGLDTNTTLSMYKVEITDEMVDEDLDAGRKRLGNRAETDETIQEGDMIKINANELDGDAIKLDGWPTTFSVLYNDIADEAVKTDLQGKKAGDTFRFNIRTIEGKRTEEFIRKHLLGVTDGDENISIGDHFEGTIESVTRMQPADLDMDFINKYFGEDNFTSVEEAKDFLREELQKSYDGQAMSVVNYELQKRLLEDNVFDLPDAFLKRWIQASNEKAPSTEQIEKDYPVFAKSMRWTLIRDKIAAIYNVEVKHEDVLNKSKQTIMQYMNGYPMPEEMLNDMAERMLKQDDQYRKTFDELLNIRVFEHATGTITITETPISKDEFETEMKAIQASIQAENAVVDALEEE